MNLPVEEWLSENNRSHFLRVRLVRILSPLCIAIAAFAAYVLLFNGGHARARTLALVVMSLALGLSAIAYLVRMAGLRALTRAVAGTQTEDQTTTIAEFHRAIRLGQPHSLASAQVWIGVLTARSGRVEDAMRLWFQAAKSSSIAIQSVANVNLGESLLRDGDIPAATARLEFAFAHGDPAVRAHAAASLGHVRALAGEPQAAEVFWNSAIQSELPSAAAVAEVYRAASWIGTGRIQDAATVLERIVATGPVEAADDARRYLAVISNDGT